MNSSNLNFFEEIRKTELDNLQNILFQYTNILFNKEQIEYRIKTIINKTVNDSRPLEKQYVLLQVFYSLLSQYNDTNETIKRHKKQGEDAFLYGNNSYKNYDTKSIKHKNRNTVNENFRFIL